MNTRNIASVIAKGTFIVAATVLASGCMQNSSSGSASSSEPATAENYVYKGQKDPLMMESATDRAAVMAERFKLVQGRI